MPYDNLCKALVERNPLPFVHWLVGQTPEPVQILKTELSVEPIRADFVSFLQVGSEILHLEFQTDPDPNMPLRMLDYYVRLRRQYQCEIVQIILFLRPTQSPQVRVKEFISQTTRHHYSPFASHLARGIPGVLSKCGKDTTVVVANPRKGCIE